MPTQIACLANYRRLLMRFLALQQPLEATLNRHLSGTEINLQERKKSHLLAADLRVLGVPDYEIHAITWRPAPPIQNEAEALGALYVSEGSTLGGMQIRAMISDALALDAETGCAFFAGYKDRTHEMWRETGAFIERRAESLPDACAIIRDA